MWLTTFKQFLTLIKKNRFFTFVNLFGISFTIMLVMILQISFESRVWPGGPEKTADKMLFLNRSVISKEKSMQLGGISNCVIKEYILNMKTPEKIGVISYSQWTYIGNNGVTDFVVKGTNAEFLSMFNYKMLEGRMYTKNEVSQSKDVIVINRKVKEQFFGNDSAVGKTIEVQDKLFTVVGVVENVPVNCETAYSDIWYPHTLFNEPLQLFNKTGRWAAVLYAANKTDFDEIKEEAAMIEKQVSAKTDGWVYKLGGPFDVLDNYLIGNIDPRMYVGKNISLLMLAGRMFFILLIPALSLIALNLTRVQERAEEIAVRKTFGASSSSLIRQILFENFMLTLIGGVIGLLMAWISIQLFGDFLFAELSSPANGIVNVTLSLLTFLVCIIVSFILSVMSGIIPARRMAKLKPALIMKGGEL